MKEAREGGRGRIPRRERFRVFRYRRLILRFPGTQVSAARHGSAGEAVKTSNVGKWQSSNFKKVAHGRPADGTPWPFYFEVDARGARILRGWRRCC